MTYQLTVIYNRPDDIAAFDAHYEQTHAPLALQIPGVQSFTSFHPEPGEDGAAPEVHLVAELSFADKAAFDAGMGSDAGQAAVNDVPNFATGGATMLAGELTTYA
ncbi:MAG: EthD family reductase [Marmoricola sp.]